MTHRGTRTLETGRLLLRPFCIKDAEAMYKNWAGDPEVSKYLTWPAHKNAEESAAILKSWISAQQDPAFCQWAIVPRDIGEPVGSISIVHLNEDIAEVETGYCIGREYWRKGYTSEALGAVIDFFFEEVGANRFTARHDPANVNSGKVMEKCGMQYEGTNRAADKNNRGLVDVCRYAILREDWAIRREIALCNSFPCTFSGFVTLPELRDGALYLVCTDKKPAVPEKKYVPGYDFAVCIGGEKIGEINLRIGYTEGLYYGGQIGYAINEAHRGKGYASRACRLLLPVAKAHGMEKLLITCNVTNTASRRVCEKLGASLLREVPLPSWTELYQRGQRRSNIFCWDITKEV